MNITLTLFGQLIVFTILILFVKRYLWEPVLDNMEARKARIADGLAASEKGAADAVAAEEEAAKLISRAKSEAAEIVSQGKTRETQIVEEAKQKASAEAEQIKVAADAELLQEINRAKDGLRTQVSELAIAGAEKILGKEIDASTHKDVLDDLVSKI
ncbi:MAG: F0F1 ATP synthase subunit B [Thiotrichaceae bacterium]|nr:F0F1 ATP synthase subunit B [Thiotrichaceae bacterium]